MNDEELLKELENWFNKYNIDNVNYTNFWNQNNIARLIKEKMIEWDRWKKKGRAVSNESKNNLKPNSYREKLDKIRENFEKEIKNGKELVSKLESKLLKCEECGDDIVKFGDGIYGCDDIWNCPTHKKDYKKKKS